MDGLCVPQTGDGGATDGGATDGGATDGGAADGGGCVDISGEYTICDDEGCRDAVCHLSTVTIAPGSGPCSFTVTSTGGARVDGTFTVDGSTVQPQVGTTFARDGTVELCSSGTVTVMGGGRLEIAFSCESCGLLLVSR